MSTASAVEGYRGLCRNLRLRAADVCRKHGISEATFYKYKASSAAWKFSDVRKLKALEDENGELKRLLAETMLDNAILKDVSSKNVWSAPRRSKRVVKPSVSKSI